MSKPLTITRKIQLLFNTENKDELKEYYNTLYRWQNICHKGANKVAAHLYWLQSQNEFVYLKEKVRLMLAKGGGELDKAETKDIYKVVSASEKEMLDTSNQNAFYQLLSHLYLGTIPSGILTALNSVIVATFNKEKIEYALGKRSLRTYKSSIPIPFQSRNMLNMRSHTDKYNGKEYHNYAFTLHNLPFKTMFGRDLSGNRSIWERAISSQLLPSWVWDVEIEFTGIVQLIQKDHADELEVPIIIKENLYIFKKVVVSEKEYYYQVLAKKEGSNDASFKIKERVKEDSPYWGIVSDYKLCDSSIQIEDNKIFLLAAFRFEKEEGFNIDPKKIAECSLDVKIPVMVKIGEKEYNIGTEEEFLHHRTRLQGSKRRLQKESAYNLGGVKRKRKLQALDRVEDAEGNYVNYKTHQYSKKLIDLCLKFGAGTIVLKDQKKKVEDAKQDEKFLLRNWSYFQLQTKIEYKAGRVGIVVKVG